MPPTTKPAADSPGKARDRRYATTLAKGLSVLQAFAPGERSLGNRELARRTGMPPSTVARMTHTLTQLGFLQQLKAEEAYCLGPAVMALGYTARASLSFLPTAEPLMQELADEVGALVALAMRDRQAAMLTRCWRPRNTPAIWLTEGHRLPLARSATGRTLLAASTPSPSAKGQTREDRAMLQSRGFLTSIGAWNDHINACAVPFWPDPSQEPVAFLCGAHADALPRKVLEETVGPRLLDRVRELERAIGLMGPRPI